MEEQVFFFLRGNWRFQTVGILDQTYKIILRKGAKTVNSLHLVLDLGASDAFAEDTSTAKRRKISGNEEHGNDDKLKRAQVAYLHWVSDSIQWLLSFSGVRSFGVSLLVAGFDDKGPQLYHVEESKYLFEAKTIQRMELLVLSTLKWKMNPVTPISFFDHTFKEIWIDD
ncbi:unnamed protein product [Fraxinus pennsylvanica]|uniref:Uncharacterized protein n=1 Tax=Fraxinus pennsylvanica TaxID=56036 RepID=A0AAD2E2Y5_9LAMI|nr:unnamed protein product [Fraxinus pennsylvanica]